MEKLQTFLTQLMAQPHKAPLAWLQENAKPEGLETDPATWLKKKNFRQIGAYTEGASTITCYMRGRKNRVGWAMMAAGLIGMIIAFPLGLILWTVGLAFALFIKFEQAWVVQTDGQPTTVFLR